MFNGIISFDFLVFDEQFKFNSVRSLCNFAQLILNEYFWRIFILICIQFVVSKKLNGQNLENWDQLQKLFCDVNVINVALLTRKYSKRFLQLITTSLSLFLGISYISPLSSPSTFNRFWLNVITALWKWIEIIPVNYPGDCNCDHQWTQLQTEIGLCDILWNFRLNEKWRRNNKQIDRRMC